MDEKEMELYETIRILSISIARQIY